MPAIIYDFKAIGGALRKQRIDDWWRPAKSEPEPKGHEGAGQYERPLMRKFARRSTEDLHDPFAGHGVWCEWIP